MTDVDLKKYREKMLRAYHNVCVYLFKENNDYEQACILEHEVIEESQRLLPQSENLSRLERERWNHIEEELKNEEEKEFVIYLFERQGLTINDYKEFCRQNENIIEQKQYMGDYYLHMNFYTLALRQFSMVFLYRKVRNGENDTKILDTIMRLFVALYACDTDLFFKFKIYAEMRIESYNSLRQRHNGNGSCGMAKKYERLVELIEISEQMDCEQDQTVQRLIEKVDEKE